MSNMAANDRKRFGIWLAIALLIVGTIIGLGLANIPSPASAHSPPDTGAFTSAEPVGSSVSLIPSTDPRARA